MPEAIALSRTVQAQKWWRDPANRVRLADVLRGYVRQQESLAVEAGDFLVDHVYVKFPEDANPGEPDVLLMVVYSIREGGIVRMEGGTEVFTGEDTSRILQKLKEEFPDLIWGPWYLPQRGAGYAQG